MVSDELMRIDDTIRMKEILESSGMVILDVEDYIDILKTAAETELSKWKFKSYNFLMKEIKRLGKL